MAPPNEHKNPTNKIEGACAKIRTLEDAEGVLALLHTTDGRVNGAYSALFAGFRQMLVLCTWLMKHAKESDQRAKNYRTRIEVMEEKLGISR